MTLIQSPLPVLVGGLMEIDCLYQGRFDHLFNATNQGYVAVSESWLLKRFQTADATGSWNVSGFSAKHP